MFETSKRQVTLLSLIFLVKCFKKQLTIGSRTVCYCALLSYSFGASTHGGSSESTCPYPFDGKGKVLAHAYYPSDGRAHFDEDEEFTDNTSKGTNLLWVATHEFGHSLGIGHSEVKGAIMYPYYTGYVEGMELHSDDIAAIQSLYGNVLEFVCLF